MALATLCQPRPSPSLAEVCRLIDGISTLPHIALRVMEVAGDPNADVRDLREVMKADAALCMRVLRCANSAAYAPRSEITNLQHAISYLGIKQIRNLAMLAGARQMFTPRNPIGSYSQRQLWCHLVAVGVCARMIALRLRFSEFDDIFLAGLLHDTGIVFEGEHVPGAFARVIYSLQQGKTLCETEREHLGFDHTELGESVAKAWKFPAAVTDSIRYHHDSAACQGSHARTVQCVAVASFLCSLGGRSSVGVHLVQFPQAAADALSLKKDDWIALATDLDGELARNQTLSQL